ncbi:MAG: glycosyltransferase family 9 protein [Candidatus Omnitrophica bacterium]|nr:glycosyltransferase family 9 protein [Candidatus Omnitrophota bacterium]
MKKRILIIKLASAGDVLRTTTLLSELKNRYPDSHLTWLVEKPGAELLEGNANIDHILVYSPETALSLQKEEFDIVISLDKAVEAASIAIAIRADEKYGFGLDEKNRLYPLNKEAEYSCLLGLDDELKFFKNKKTYQEITFESTGLVYKDNPYELVLNKRHIDFAGNFFKKNNLDRRNLIIGINTGAGDVFANKNLRKERIVELIRLLDKEVDAKIILLGGPLEKDINRYIEKMLDYRVINSGCGNSLKDFAALIGDCSLIITADTLALHIAIALKKPVVALFGPTCPQEIELYGRGSKVVTQAECAPCYRKECGKEPNCMDMIELNDIGKKVKGFSQVEVRL